MIDLSISIDRTSLGTTPLVITNNPHGTSLHLPEDAATWPVFDTRKTRGPASAYVKGPGALLAAVRDAAAMPVTIYAHADTAAALNTAKAELEAAVAQWSYGLTLTVDSVAHAYTAEILLDLPWGSVDSGMVRAHMASASFTIPLNP